MFAFLVFYPFLYLSYFYLSVSHIAYSISSGPGKRGKATISQKAGILSFASNQHSSIIYSYLFTGQYHISLFPPVYP